MRIKVHRGVLDVLQHWYQQQGFQSSVQLISERQEDAKFGQKFCSTEASLILAQEDDSQ